MVLFQFLVALAILWISYKWYRWANPKCKGVLPPGSMGLPIIGETIQFFSTTTLNDMPPFISKRIARYGPLFRTNLASEQVIVSTDSDINHYVFQHEGTLFHSWYTESFVNIIGQDNIMVSQGAVHKHLKNLVLYLVSPEALKEKVMTEVDDLIVKNLHLWSKQGDVNIKEAYADVLIDYFAKKLFSYDETRVGKKLRENYKYFLHGLISFPLNIPGTAYHACFKGRNNVLKLIRETIIERRLSKKRNGDFLDYLLEEVDKEGTLLTESTAVQLIFILLFAGFETTSASLTFAIKFIANRPDVLSELVKEHEAILKDHKSGDSTLTWKEYKSMTFTFMVINETMRLANFVPGVFRRAAEDVKIKGYTIPAGWLVMVVPSSVHLDPEKYEDPLEFNPWRWTGRELHTASKNFMPFGGGSRLCVGADFAKLQIAIFLHHLVTNYRWTIKKGGEIIRHPAVMFPNGMNIGLMKKHNQNLPVNDVKIN